MLDNCGNSCSRNLSAFPSLPISTSKPLFNKALMIGIHRVACPKPQFKGATRMVFLDDEFDRMENSLILRG